GGAVGLMMLAVWSLATTADLRVLTPLRTLMVAAANGIAVLCFAAAGSVSWRESLIVMGGGVVGGYIGARVGWRLPAPVLRALILTITIITTVVFFVRAYWAEAPAV
ncbi:MAG: TSUP family transporter, partial [Phenylobacterium sp.]|uniref:TSUP family transporter n=1 Tax=Phenylobacterium sp. TaxID=1871053 RepID=UPI002735B216